MINDLFVLFRSKTEIFLIYIELKNNKLNKLKIEYLKSTS